MLYHPKMGKLLAKERNVTKVPVHTYGGREREKERERERGQNFYVPVKQRSPV